MNFHRVSFEITNRVVALYDAGVAGDPPTAAPNPTTATTSWGRHQATPLAGTGVTNVSPDTVPLPTAPDATTLSPTGVQPYQAILSGGINPRGLSTVIVSSGGTDRQLREPHSVAAAYGTPDTTVTETITGLSKGIYLSLSCMRAITWASRTTSIGGCSLRPGFQRRDPCQRRLRLSYDK